MWTMGNVDGRFRGDRASGDQGLCQDSGMKTARLLFVMGLLAPGWCGAGEFLDGEAWKGFVLSLHEKTNAYTYEKELRQIAEMGADSVLIIVTCYQENAKSTTMERSNNGVPTRERLLDILARAHSYDLSVLLQPIVLLRNPKTTKEWRGAIRPKSRKEWFRNYEEFITYFAEIAAEGKVEALSVGSEFVSMEFFWESWEEVIAKVRSIYGGKLIYSANWDHYEEVPFWDKLDAVGVTSYHTLSKSDPPKREEAEKKWKEIREALLGWQSKVGKPIVFTEIGYPSQKTGAKEPWNYYGSKEADLEVQEMCLEVCLETWEGTPEVGAYFIFEWWGDGGPQDVGYMPWGKPAEALLRGWFLE